MEASRLAEAAKRALAVATAQAQEALQEAERQRQADLALRGDFRVGDEVVLRRLTQAACVRV